MTEPAWFVQVEPEAMRLAAEHLQSDPEGLAALFAALDTLAEEPRPAEAFPYGPDILRLRVGGWRALYEIFEADKLIVVLHIGRSG